MIENQSAHTASAHTWVAMLTAVFCGACASTATSQAPYRILVTNDDGIESPGIQVLARALADVGDVVVVAPCGQQSGASMSIRFRQELRLRTLNRVEGLTEYCVDTTPAGAVFFAITTLAPEEGFDLVVSGINRGTNVGDVSHGSGTVGAAMAGAFHGIPAVAASLGTPATDFAYAASFVADFVRELRSRSSEAGIVYSINIPKESRDDTKGVVVAPMGGSFLNVEYEETEGDAEGRRFQPRFGSPQPYPAGSDSEAFAEDMITITPLEFDWTAHELLETVKAWGLSP